MEHNAIKIFLGILLGLCLPAEPIWGQVQVPINKLWEATKWGLETSAKAGKAAQSIEEHLREYENLSDIEDFNLDREGMPQLPSVCAESAECAECFGKAHNDLVFYRFQLEKLRIIYQGTRSYANSAIAFGDNVSGIHAVSGLPWQTQRRQIKESLRNFGETYDEKYEQLIKGLLKALKRLGECEAEFGEEGWYDRFGFIYYTFMQDRYKRSSVE